MQYIPTRWPPVWMCLAPNPDFGERVPSKTFSGQHSQHCHPSLMIWAEISQAYTKASTQTVLLIGSDAAQIPDLPGHPLEKTQVVSYHRWRDVNVDGDVSAALNIFRIREMDALSRRAIPNDVPTLAIYAFNWLHTELWPSQLAALLRDIPAGTKLIFTTSSFSELLQQSQSVPLSEKVDFCHQFLRVVALKHQAGLVYNATNDDKPAIDWRAILMKETSIPVAFSEPPKENLFGPSYVIYSASSDSREKILAVNPSFDYDAALDGSLSLAPLVETKPASAQQPQASLSAALHGVIDEYLARRDGRQVGSNMESQAPVILDQDADDKQVISEFFTAIAQKYT